MIFNHEKVYQTDIKPEWERKANEEAEKLRENWGEKSTHIYRQDKKFNDVIGVMGREIFTEWAEKTKFNCEIGQYVEKGYGDNGDIVVEDNIIGDIKTKYSKDRDFFLSSTTCSIFGNQYNSEKDLRNSFYVFCGWVSENKKGYIFGWCLKSYFDEFNYELPKGTVIGNWIAFGSREIEARRLMPIEDLTEANLKWFIDREKNGRI